MMAKEDRHMTTTTATAARGGSAIVAFLISATIGIGIIVVSGHVQAETLHAAAHDVRHATGFPCH